MGCFARLPGLTRCIAAFTGANYQTPGALEYRTFLRATEFYTNDLRQKVLAFKPIVFNVVFNNRDDHPKNVAYLMSPTGQWSLAPAYDVTFCKGPGGYHQIDAMGGGFGHKSVTLDGIRGAGNGAFGRWGERGY